MFTMTLYRPINPYSKTDPIININGTNRCDFHLWWQNTLTFINNVRVNKWGNFIAVGLILIFHFIKRWTEEFDFNFIIIATIYDFNKRNTEMSLSHRLKINYNLHSVMKFCTSRENNWKIKGLERIIYFFNIFWEWLLIRSENYLLLWSLSSQIWTWIR